MTERRQRFLRLASLREKQHDETVATLRSARHLLEAKLREVAAHEAQSRQALTEQHNALVAADQYSWMLSCAAYELESLHAMQQRSHCEELQAAVTVAEAAEVHARREHRQTERLLESIREEESAAASLKEQKTLDEAAQVLKIRSSKQANGLSTLS